MYHTCETASRSGSSPATTRTGASCRPGRRRPSACGGPSTMHPSPSRLSSCLALQARIAPQLTSPLPKNATIVGALVPFLPPHSHSLSLWLLPPLARARLPYTNHSISPHPPHIPDVGRVTPHHPRNGGMVHHAPSGRCVHTHFLSFGYSAPAENTE
ncbi:hypothetical protein K438DRAFT_1990358 [Mycena galopus ATCC 62051]|nr:hypothetical protein K438DRAFT_1990358 [Mycena galopus ATCC 62051]